MKYIMICILVLLTTMASAQDIDTKRMKRDIEVAEKILTSLLEEEQSESFLPGPYGRVEGTYLDGYGVLFSIRRPSFRLMTGQTAVIIDSDRADAPRAPKPARGSGVSKNESSEFSAEEMKQLAEEFFAEYGFLLSQVPANEQICLKYSPSGSGISIGNVNYQINGQRVADQRYTAVIRKGVVEEFHQGKVDRKALAAGIDFSESNGEAQTANRKLVLLSSIMERLYQRDLSEGFVMVGRGRVEEIKGLGAIFYYNFTDDTRRSGLWNAAPDFFFGEGTGQSRIYVPFPELTEAELAEGDEEEEDDEQELPDFNEFLQDFSRNVVEYGSTVNDLSADEVLTFYLKFPPCKDCEDRPEQVKIIAKQSVLEGYRSGRLSLEAAADKLQISR